jgi:hypothetical protein
LRDVELISQRYERGATLITSNLPFDEWTETFGSERLTGALLDRLTHHVSILEMNGDSYRLGQSRARKTQAASRSSTVKIGPDGPERPGTRQLYGERACHGAHPARPSENAALNCPTLASACGPVFRRR